MPEPRDPATEAQIEQAAREIADAARHDYFSGMTAHAILRRHWPEPPRTHSPCLALDLTEHLWAAIQRPQPAVSWEELFQLVSQRLRAS